MLLHFAQRSSGAPAHSRHPRLIDALVAIALSLVVHVVLFAVLHQPAPSPDVVPERRAPLTVYLRSSLPENVPVQVRRRTPSALPATTKKPGQPDAVRPDPQPASKTVILPDRQAHPASHERAKRLDVDSVYQQLGKVVGELDRENGDSPVGQLQARSRTALRTESGLSRDVTRAARNDCMAPASLPGGLLAPLYLLMDRKGTGCKF